MPYRARRSKLHPQTQTQFQAPRRLPTLTRQFPQVVDMGDGAEERPEMETVEEHLHLRIREASAPP